MGVEQKIGSNIYLKPNNIYTFQNANLNNNDFKSCIMIKEHYAL